MLSKISSCAALISILVSTGFAQGAPAPPSGQLQPSPNIVDCRVMEVFLAAGQGVYAIIFHQRDKSDGAKLGDLLKAYSGRDVEFETKDGRKHHATIYRVKSCFGRGLMIIAADDVHLEPQDEFALRFPEIK